MSLPMKSLEILPWPLMRFSFSRPEVGPAVAYFSDSLQGMDVRMTPLRDGWLPVTHDSTSLEQSSVPSGPFNIDRHCVPG
jgi:hypothetical protein